MAKRAKTPAQKIVRQLTTEKDLITLAKACRGHEKNIAEYVGSLREKIAYAVDKKHLHKKAFAIFRSLDKMEPAKLAEFFDHFDHYCDVGGLRDRAESAPGLDLQDDDAEDDDTPAGSVPRPRVVGGTAASGEPG